MSTAEKTKPFDPETDTVTYDPSNPGCVPVRTFGKFTPDGMGGGSLKFYEEVVEYRKGFRPKVKVVERIVRKDVRMESGS